MINSRWKKWIFNFVCFFMVYLLGCGNETPTGSNEQAPDIPPLGTMSIDLSFFNTQGSRQTGTRIDQVLDKNNFITAVAVVTTFNLAVLVGISVPVAATSVALSVEPTLQSDGKFHWNFSYPKNNPTLTLELTAQVLPGVVNWEMFVSRQLPTPLKNFLWYEGQNQINGTSGYWQFYDDKKPTEKHKTVRIDWQYVSEDNRTLTFLNNNEDDQGFGDKLTYSIEGDDVGMLFFRAATKDTIEVAWNKTNGEGYIIAPFYNSGQKSCWDSNQNDVTCP